MVLDWVLLRLIRWVRSNPEKRWRKTPVERFDGSFLFTRYEPFWRDEFVSKKTGKHYDRPPWWRPFGALLHRWHPADAKGEEMHDHPRWSITLCMRGRLIERTPWGERLLKPGSIVIRSRRYIHSFSIPQGYSGKTWTLFIVGRRNHAQNTYAVTPQMT